VKPLLIVDDFYETESGFELFVGKAGQGNPKKILVGAFGAIVADDAGAVEAVLFASFELDEVNQYVKKHKDVETENCARCYRAFVPSDDGGLCSSCKR
jgi:hypothetical protein